MTSGSGPRVVVVGSGVAGAATAFALARAGAAVTVLEAGEAGPATAAGAGGLTMGPLAGHLLAQLVLTGAADLDLAPFAPHHPEA